MSSIGRCQTNGRRRIEAGDTKRRRAVLAFAAATSCLSSTTPSSAEILARAASGFELRITRTIAQPPTDVYRKAVRDVARWWDPEHTYSGQASNLTLEPRAGGCFCERLPNRGSVQHMQVAHVAPGHTIRMLGGLGPLQALAASGALTWTFEPTPDGGTRMVWTYRVTGLETPEVETLAPVVDQVLTIQAERLLRFAGGSKP